MTKIAIGCDHGAYTLKEEMKVYLADKGYEVEDCGTYSADSVHYPIYAKAVCEKVQKGDAVYGILLCSTGIGMSICANKIKGIRCAHVTDIFSAEVTRKHNDTNVIALGARISTKEDVIKFIDKFLNTGFEGGRHQNRVNKVNELDK